MILFYGIRIVRVPGVHTSWKEVQLQIIGVRNDVNRYNKREEAEDFLKKVTILGRPPLLSPTATIPERPGHLARLAGRFTYFSIQIPSLLRPPRRGQPR